MVRFFMVAAGVLGFAETAVLFGRMRELLGIEWGGPDRVISGVGSLLVAWQLAHMAKTWLEARLETFGPESRALPGDSQIDIMRKVDKLLRAYEANTRTILRFGAVLLGIVTVSGILLLPVGDRLVLRTTLSLVLLAVIGVIAWCYRVREKI